MAHQNNFKPKTKILLVEDEPVTQRKHIEILHSLGYPQVDLVSTGIETLNKFYENQYDLILLDIGLPDINGILICQILRHNTNKPIIMFSTQIEQWKKSCLAAGANDFATKPILPETLEILLNKWWTKNSQSNLIEGQKKGNKINLT